MALSLTDETRSTLSELARSRTAPAHHVERSAIVLHLADRRSASETAAALGIHRQRVTRCARRVAAVGPLEAIDDLPRSGRPPDLTEASRSWLIGEACAKLKDRGYPHELWTLRNPRLPIRSVGRPCLPGQTRGECGPWHSEQSQAPQGVLLLKRRDPNFDERKAKVMEVYAAAETLRALPEAERPAAIGIQAIATTAPDLPPKPRKHSTVQRDHEYKRRGTVTLSAAVDLVTGIVHHAVTERHRSREFVAFLQKLDAS
jgi:hypothetical protein